MSDIRARYGTDSLPELVRLLEAPEMQQYLRQTVLVIGVIGGEAGTDFLLKFLKRFSGEVSDEQMGAIRSVPVALGERARQGDRRALSFLLSHHTMQAWRDAPPSWWHGRKKDDALYQDLAHETLLGLAVVPDPQVSVVFEKLAHDPSDDYAELRRRLLDLPEILKLRQMVLKHLRGEATSPGRGARDAQREPGLVHQSSPPPARQESRDKLRPLPAEDAKSLALVALREYQVVSQLFPAPKS